MAIAQTTISKAAGWARTDVIDQLEQAFTWLEWHGNTVSGIVTGFQLSGGGTGSAMAFQTYEDVFPTTTSGIGTGASFFIARTTGGAINLFFVNRPGVGYTDGEFLTISGDQIGGIVNGATGIGITVQVAGGESPVGFGSTTTFFDKDVTAGVTNPWGVLKLEVDSNKEYGTTYRGFQVNSNTSLSIRSGSAFHPADTTNTSNGGNYRPNRFAGSSGLDLHQNEGVQSFGYRNNSSIERNQTSLTFASSNSYQLDLNVFRSSIDPNFAVISFKQPTLSSTYITQNTFQTFIIHNFTNSLYDLDYLFLGGTTFINPQAQNSPGLQFRSFTSATGSGVNDDSIRTAEFGHCNDNSGNEKRSVYYSSIFPISQLEGSNTFYNRRDANSTKGFYNSSLPSEVYFNPVIKGLPLNPLLIPSPYYIPDDFVLIDFQINTPSVNIQQGDTITISGSEVYTVITASYNQTTTTRGLAFCARTI